MCIRSIYRKFTVLGLAICTVILFLLLFEKRIAEEPLPVFSSYTDVVSKKRAFIAFFKQQVEQANAKIEAKRQRLFAIYATHAVGDELSQADREWVYALANEYKAVGFDVTDKTTWTKLTKLVDIVPVSMALGQGAVESAWGTSRFAVEGNNFFGMWCYTEGCGMIPKNRKAELSHEVRRYASVEDAVAHYIHTLNTHAAYLEFRRLRYKQRKDYGRLSGYQLMGELKHYSQMGDSYIALVRKVIQGNRLESYTAIDF